MPFSYQEWGFGCCTKSSQYKIVRIAYYREGDFLGNGETVARVLSYRIDCEWRKLDFSNNKNALFDGPGITVKGTVFWKYTIIEKRLLSFDLEEEEFAWIICPRGACLKIMEFQGSLAACKLSETSERKYDIHVLKDAGNVDSWKTICSAGYIFPSLPIGFLNDHMLFLVDKGWKDAFGKDTVEFSCALYDLEHEDIKRIPQALAYNSSDVLKFVESMVPLLP